MLHNADFDSHGKLSSLMSIGIQSDGMQFKTNPNYWYGLTGTKRARRTKRSGLGFEIDEILPSNR